MAGVAQISVDQLGARIQFVLGPGDRSMQPCA